MSIISMFPGGAIMPAIVNTGSQYIYNKIDIAASVSGTAPYVNVGTGWGFTTMKTGIYKVTFVVTSDAGGYFPTSCYSRLTLNGTAITGSEVVTINPVIKTMDLALVAGDVVRLQFHGATRDSGSTDYDWSAILLYFGVAIDASELQTELNTYITAV